ncbi:Protein YIPF [Rhynchospora pubera]|uniref:Protein YIP n=1 Tax=Rhynchospora pubera TaxID=906938 RepID=A0AAV8C276_9POAL|nr:Protein YIPF [Rhynchospora pubera]
MLTRNTKTKYILATYDSDSTSSTSSSSRALFLFPRSHHLFLSLSLSFWRACSADYRVLLSLSKDRNQSKMMSGSGSGYTSIDNQKVSGSVPAASGSDLPSVQFSASNLQTFPPSEAKGKISGGYQPPRDADDTFSRPGGSSSSDESQNNGWLRMFTIEAYKPFFDVDTSDLLERIKDSLFPFKGSFQEKTAENPDLYGPFWICTTLILVAAAIGAFVTYLEHKWHKKEYNYDINLVTWSFGLFYGYVLLVPLGLYLILKYFSAPSGLVQLWCLYGYSLFVFIPAMCLSIVPLEIFRWVVVGIAGFMSATFISVNMRAHIVSSAGERWFLIVAGIFLLQLALAVILKLYFFAVTVST